MTKARKPIITIHADPRPIAMLKPNPWNKAIFSPYPDEERLKKVTKRLERSRSLRYPIGIRADGLVLDDHINLVAALNAGLTEVGVTVLKPHATTYLEFFYFLDTKIKIRPLTASETAKAFTVLRDILLIRPPPHLRLVGIHLQALEALAEIKRDGVTDRANTLYALGRLLDVAQFGAEMVRSVPKTPPPAGTTHPIRFPPALNPPTGAAGTKR